MFLKNHLYRNINMADVDMYVCEVLNKTNNYMLEVFWYHRQYKSFIGKKDQVEVKQDHFKDWYLV